MNLQSCSIKHQNGLKLCIEFSHPLIIEEQLLKFWVRLKVQTIAQQLQFIAIKQHHLWPHWSSLLKIRYSTVTSRASLEFITQDPLLNSH